MPVCVYADGKYCLNSVLYTIFDWVWTCLVILSHELRTFGVLLRQPRSSTGPLSEGLGGLFSAVHNHLFSFKRETD